MRNVIPTFSSISACNSFEKLKNGLFLTSPKCLFVSGRKNAVTKTAPRETSPAIIKGSAGLIDTVKAEIAGPKTNPKPKAPQRIPKPLVLSSGFVVSDMTAEATGIFPAVIPSSALAMNRNIALGAKAAIKKDAAVPIKEISNKGFLPYLSERRPIIGVAKN